jgi:hypothetical protein
LGSESANPNNEMQISIGKISSIFRFTFCCEYLSMIKAEAPSDKTTDPVRTAPVIPMITPITTIINEKFLI